MALLRKAEVKGLESNWLPLFFWEEAGSQSSDAWQCLCLHSRPHLSRAALDSCQGSKICICQRERENLEILMRRGKVAKCFILQLRVEWVKICVNVGLWGLKFVVAALKEAVSDRYSFSAESNTLLLQLEYISLYSYRCFLVKVLRLHVSISSEVYYISFFCIL